VNALALAPDGQSFASAGSYLDGRVRLWGYPAASPIWQAFGEVAVWSLAFAPDGRTLACGGSFGAVRLRASSDGTELRVLESGDSLVNALAYAPDGGRLAASEGANVGVFDPASGTSLGVLSGHTGSVFALAFSPDGRLLASGSDDASVRLWSF